MPLPQIEAQDTEVAVVEAVDSDVVVDEAGDAEDDGAKEE